MATGWLSIASSYSVLPKSLRTVLGCHVPKEAGLLSRWPQGVTAPGCACVSPSSGDSGQGWVPSLHLHKQDTPSWDTKPLFSHSPRGWTSWSQHGQGLVAALFLSTDSRLLPVSSHGRERALVSTSSSFF